MNIPENLGLMTEAAQKQWIQNVSVLHPAELHSTLKGLMPLVVDMPYRDRCVVERLLRNIQNRMRMKGDRSIRLWNACWCLADGRMTSLIVSA